MVDYRVNLDVYNGPMDLLLYLIRRDEIDINDIPLAKITEQYCAHVDMIHQLDPDLAGEFLVLAATLMEIKTRMLLPRVEGQPAEGDEDFDPRADLVRQLLQYKAFKDAAGDLRDAAYENSLRFPRAPGELELEEDGKDLEDVQIWDLVEAFSAVMKSIGQDNRHEIIYDDTPIELHASDILDRLGREGNMTFRQVFAGRTRRTEMVGLFLAMLELIRRRSIRIQQERAFGEIYVFLRDANEPPGTVAPPVSVDDDAPAEPAQLPIANCPLPIEQPEPVPPTTVAPDSATENGGAFPVTEMGHYEPTARPGEPPPGEFPTDEPASGQADTDYPQSETDTEDGNSNEHRGDDPGQGD
jgi:segregation and condensation protein A